MRHRNDRNNDRHQDRNSNDRNFDRSHDRYQDSHRESGRESQYGQRRDWQGGGSADSDFNSYNSDRSYGNSGQAYRTDDMNGFNTRAPGDDYGSREYQASGAVSRTFNNDYRNDNFSNESIGNWGRGASEEESRSYGSRGDVNSQNYQTSRGDRESDDNMYGSMRTSYGQPQRRSPSGDQGKDRNQGVGYLNRSGDEGWNQQGRSQGQQGSRESQDYGTQTYGGHNRWSPTQSPEWQRNNARQHEEMNAQGRHFGKGPKGFKRSDDRIKEEVSEALTRHHDVDASDIDIDVKEGEVTLSGFVSERRMKHLAEDVAEGCMGVKDVTNNIRVRREEGRGESMDSQSANSSSMDADGSSSGDRKGASSSASSSSGAAGQTSGSKKSGSSTSTNPH